MFWMENYSVDIWEILYLFYHEIILRFTDLERYVSCRVLRRVLFVLTQWLPSIMYISVQSCYQSIHCSTNDLGLTYLIKIDLYKLEGVLPWDCYVNYDWLIVEVCLCMFCYKHFHWLIVCLQCKSIDLPVWVVTVTYINDL